MQIRKPQTDDKTITEILSAIAGYQAFLVAHDLHLFERLHEKPLTLEAICAALNIARRPAQALLTVCAALGLIEISDEGYRLTSVAQDYLVKSSPFYADTLIDFDCIQNGFLYSFDHIKRAVLTNHSQAYEGQQIFAIHQEQADMADQFTAMMHAHSLAPASAWVEKIDLSGYAMMLDVGGGSAAHSLAATRRWPNLRATVFELPVVCRLAKGYIEQSGLSHRIRTHSGDMWQDELPPGDVHFYSDIFHDWSPEQGLELAQKSFASLKGGGRIIIHEMLLSDDKCGPFAVAASGIAMLLWSEGQQYSGRELGDLLAEAGFVEVEVKPTFGYWSLITGIKR